VNDPVTLEQLRSFLAVVEEGSFSAAARRLKRVQSAVSHAIASLEQRLGITLLDRSTRTVALTPQGEALLAAAQRVCMQADALRGLAIELRGGLEASVSLCVDSLFPVPVLVRLCREFAAHFPSVQLKVHTETLAAVTATVQEGACDLGIAVSVAVPAGTAIERHHLMSIEMVPVAAASHPLAQLRGPLSAERLRDFTQIVLSERGSERLPDQGVISPKTWRVVDVGSKHALLLEGLGWGNMPRHMIRADLETGRLVMIRPEAWSADEPRVALVVIHKPGLVMRPATRWFLREMKALCRHEDPAPPVEVPEEIPVAVAAPAIPVEVSAPRPAPPSAPARPRPTPEPLKKKSRRTLR
jgi:DNA-binding transcriptional LysR family regulator